MIFYSAPNIPCIKPIEFSNPSGEVLNHLDIAVAENKVVQKGLGNHISVSFTLPIYLKGKFRDIQLNIVTADIIHSSVDNGLKDRTFGVALEKEVSVFIVLSPQHIILTPNIFLFVGWGCLKDIWSYSGEIKLISRCIA